MVLQSYVGRFSTWNDDISLMMSLFIVNLEAEKLVLMNENVFENDSGADVGANFEERTLFPYVWAMFFTIHAWS